MHIGRSRGLSKSTTRLQVIKRIGEPVRPGVKYRLRPGAYAVLVNGSDILLTHQSQPHPEFQLPGGGIDPGEQIHRALHREVLEETGWSMQLLRRLGAFRRFTYMPEYDLWAEKICHIYLCRPNRRISHPLEPDHEAVWTDLATASQILGNTGDRGFVDRAAKLLGYL